MPSRRAVAFAQALTMILLLLPGPGPSGPAPVEAAVEPADAPAVNVFDAAGRGIGCQAGTRKYKGPALPKDPPWPPGAQPTPRPEPSTEPSTEPSADPSSESSADPATEPSSDPSLEVGDAGTPGATSAPAAAAGTALVAAVGTRLVQAELEPEPLTAQATPKPRLLPGIDVSHHNGDIDYDRVRDAGHRFVFIKATQDIDFIDPMFPTNVARARAAGLAVGAYHFFDYTLDGRSQADHFLDRVEAAGGIDGALPPVVDVECWAPIGASIHAVSTARLRDFVERVYERTGRLPMIYTSVFMWREVVGDAEGFEDLPLWAACWGCEEPPSLAPGWDDWAFWQTGLTRIPDVGRLDGNYFGGGGKDLDSLKLRPFSLAGGAIATSSELVELDLGGRVGSHLRTSSDGEEWSSWSRIREVASAQLPRAEGEYEVFAQLRLGMGLESPVLSDSIMVDRTPPEISAAPTVVLRTGALGALGEGSASLPVTVAWEARDEVAGLSEASVLAACADAGSQRADALSPAAPGEAATPEVAAWLFPDASCEVTSISRDGAGNVSRVQGAQTITLSTQADGTAIAGDQFGVIAGRGPDGGRAVVLIDGEAAGLVDLYAPQVSGPEVVFVADLTAGSHDIVLEPTGSADAASSGTALTIDGYVSLVTQASAR
jgi:GH25 family lysozyme M1 (1,4-beta-N-acetylmuramidase)